MSNYYVYMLRCRDDSIYTGITTDLQRRFQEHSRQGEKSAKYTRTHGVKQLECAWQCENRQLASKLEYHIKKLTKVQKETIIRTGELEQVFKEQVDCSRYEVKK
jgi:putative endonuclease